MAQLDIDKQASYEDYRVMSMKWLSRLPQIFKPAEIMPAEFVDRDAERGRRELELIRIRFPRHA
jgi:hypothetical protein